MSDESTTHMYHCEHCKKLYLHADELISQRRCPHCGLNPAKSEFRELSKRPALDRKQLDKNRGVAGKDVADFISVNRLNRQKKVRYFYMIWGLVLFGSVAYVVQDKVKGVRYVAPVNARDTWQFKNKEKKATIRCSEVFQKLVSADTENLRVTAILNGSAYAEVFKTYYADPINKNNLRNLFSLELVKSRLSVDGEFERLDMSFVALDKDKNRVIHEYETVFWKVDDSWLLDWLQFTRLGAGATSWSDYIADEESVEPHLFRVYVRIPSTSSSSAGYSDLVVSKALNNTTNKAVLPVSVLVKDDSQIKKEISKLLREKRYKEVDEDQIRGRGDSRIAIRIQAEIGYETVAEQRRLVLKRIIRTDWLDIPKKMKKAELDIAIPE